MDREKALDKIAKLKALSASPVPAEAAAALRQMYKLMEQFAIDDDEVNALRVEEVLIELSVKAPALWETTMAAAIARKFGIGCYMRRNATVGRDEDDDLPGTIGTVIAFYGVKHRHLGAEYAYRYLRRCAFAAREEYKKSFDRAPRNVDLNAYLHGFVHTAIKALDEIVPDAQEALALEDFSASKHLSGAKKTRLTGSADSYAAGIADGAKVRTLKHGVGATGPVRGIEG